jgi:hypothetical protein
MTTMATAPATTSHKNSLVADSVTISCPPIPNGGGGGLLLQPNFKASGTYTKNQQDSLGCVFKTAAGVTINPTSMTINPPPADTWCATFNINAGTNGTLHAFIKVNGNEVATANVANLQVVQNGGGTCNC